jgi:hypothetical protein
MNPVQLKTPKLQRGSDVPNGIESRCSFFVLGQTQDTLDDNLGTILNYRKLAART